MARLPPLQEAEDGVMKKEHRPPAEDQGIAEEEQGG
jgi:hypothetical protein